LRLAVAFPLLVLAVCAGLVAFAFAAPARSRQDAAEVPRTGVELLRAYRCRQAETKRIILRGVEDGFSPVGDEPTSLRAGRRNAFTLSFVNVGAYDQYAADSRMGDSIESPSRVARGLFVMSLRRIGSNANDTISIGDLSSQGRSVWGGRRFGGHPSSLVPAVGWQRQGTLYFAELDQVRFLPQIPGMPAALRDGPLGRSFATLLDYIRAGDGRTWVDVMIEDDTSVDFIGMAVCEEPPRGKGLTMAPAIYPKARLRNLTVMACRAVKDDDHICNPYVGDTPCSTSLPITCLRPGDAPRPAVTQDTFAQTTWSGGTLAFTEPVRGDRFRTIRDADRHCAARFGADWRTATMHDGVQEGISAFSGPGPEPARAWVDIADQPYATCWARR
jgi:hypothetical protein